MTDDEREELVTQIAEWIDTTVIAEMIVASLEEEEGELTLERCKETWYGTLENLGSGIGLAI